MSNQPSSTESDTLRAQIFQRLHPHAYLDRFLIEGVRPDGRAPDEWRDVFINVGSISTADGSALVRIGGTTIVCGVKAEIAEPELDTPGEGFLVPNIDLPAICSPKFKPGPPSEEAQVLSERLNTALISAQLLPLTTLCIAPGRSVWCLYVDATCINYDGNVFDAALLAMVAALRNTTLPDATYNEEAERTTCPSRTARHPLVLNEDKIVVGLSFGVVPTPSIPQGLDSAEGKDGPHTLGPTLLIDPSAFEEPLLARVITVIIDSQGRIVGMEGGVCGESNTDHGQEDGLGFVERSIRAAQKRAEILHELLR
ncbi:ribosomal protein S5 domain 2-type protein [Scleroderma yunnanense]